MKINYQFKIEHLRFASIPILILGIKILQHFDLHFDLQLNLSSAVAAMPTPTPTPSATPRVVITTVEPEFLAQLDDQHGPNWQALSIQYGPAGVRDRVLIVSSGALNELISTGEIQSSESESRFATALGGLGHFAQNHDGLLEESVAAHYQILNQVIRPQNPQQVLAVEEDRALAFMRSLRNAAAPENASLLLDFVGHKNHSISDSAVTLLGQIISGRMLWGETAAPESFAYYAPNYSDVLRNQALRRDDWLALMHEIIAKVHALPERTAALEQLEASVLERMQQL